MHKCLSFLMVTFLMFAAGKSGAQTQFWSDDFEGAAPSSGVRTPTNNGGVGGPPYTSYFCRTPATATVSQVVAFTGMQGTNYWAGEFHNAAGTGFTGAGTADAREQRITWTGIDITGRTGLTFTGAFAANSTNQPFDNRNACGGGATTNTDYVILQYQVDAGPWVNAIKFFTMGPLTGKYLFLETTGDSCGDGAQITNVFQDFSANISGTGTSLSLRLLAASDAANEEWGVDNFRLFQSGVLPLTFGSFTARQKGSDVVLDWSTLTELDTKDFTVQYNTDGSGSWSDIATVAAAGNSNDLKHYSYTHQSAQDGNNFYRIRQTDKDGRTLFTNVEVVNKASDNDAFTILGNPVTNGVLNIKVNSPSNLSLFNAQGKMVWHKQVSAGSLAIPVNTFTKGIYLLRSENSSKRVSIR